MELGFAKAIAVKHFNSDWSLDKDMNQWLEDNPNIEILEIKYGSNATQDDWGSNALIIYRK